MLILDELAEKFKSIKTLPHVAIKLSKMIAANEGRSSEYEAIIRHDPALVMRVFKLVNSSFFSLRDKVESLSDAIVHIGLDNLRNMIVIEAVRDLFKKGPDGDVFSRKKLWMHCVATGICARMISEKIFGDNGEDAFLCGLLHDIGLIIEEQLEPELFITMLQAYENNAPFLEHEKEYIGVNHCETGFWLARNWKLPASVQFGIRDHHLIDETAEPSSMTGILQLSELMVQKLKFSAVPEMCEALPNVLLLHMRENIGDYKLIIKALPKEIKKARDIYRL